jgi:hypothetical protein
MSTDWAARPRNFSRNRITAAEENDEEAAPAILRPGTSTPNPANLYERMSCLSLHIQIRSDPIPKNYFTHPAGRARKGEA